MDAQVKFHASNGKRQILIVDDDLINSSILEANLQNDYEVLLADNGQSGMEIVQREKKTLSLVLLDLHMPVMSGTEMLQRLKQDPETAKIPVIVLTSDQSAEIDCLNKGAIDFIPKPYPQPDVVLARIRRIIELSEDRNTIDVTERDPLTGLYNREYFYYYAEQFDQFHPEIEMDAIVVDIFHFRLLNERFGTPYGDEVLRQVGEGLLHIVRDSDGIVSRRGADTFLVYCPHRTEYETMLSDVTAEVQMRLNGQNRIRLKMGVYSDVDKGIDIVRRFDRAKVAVDTLRSSATKTVAVYDQALHEKELFEEHLIEDFERAVEERQFTVYYQPKFDVRGEQAVLAGAEALVRWIHPKLGFISPGVFIPLFEENGLIEQLDYYVWEAASAQIKAWKEEYGFNVPVSVNVSRIDMYDPGMIHALESLLTQYSLNPAELHLEVTESAYTEDSDQIIDRVSRLREMGFRVEMDDFGIGYSSLNMLSSLPIDAIKLDMQFVRRAFAAQRDTRMVKIVLEIAESLGVPVIAEGVETEEQMRTLKMMGCDLIQGYYFSAPVAPGQFRQFLEERKRLESARVGLLKKRAAADDAVLQDLMEHASKEFESLFFVDADTGEYRKYLGKDGREKSELPRMGTDFFGDLVRAVEQGVFREDSGRVKKALSREKVKACLKERAPYMVTYRTSGGAGELFHSLKLMPAGEGQVAFGISSTDGQFRRAQDKIGAISLQNLAAALSGKVENVYCIDLESDAYVRFYTEGPYDALKLEDSGKEFFSECRKDISSLIYLDDQDRVRDALEKRQIQHILEEQCGFSMEYRLMKGGHPVFYRLKVLPASEQDADRALIAVYNIDAQISETEKLELERQNKNAYSKIAQALARDCFSIYYVDTSTDHYIEYSSNHKYRELGIERSGEKFFESSQKNFEQVVYPQDLEKVRSIFTKDLVMQELEMNGSFTMTYRLLFSDEPRYVSLKAVRMGNREDPHIIVGISSIDSQVKREKAFDRRTDAAGSQTNRDKLTGVKNKAAFNEAEESWNQEIKRGTEERFAVAVFGLDALEQPEGEAQAHAISEQSIKKACSSICTIFKHSPVYRIGRETFAAVMRGRDYECRRSLEKAVAEANEVFRENGEVLTACGMSDFIPGVDGSFARVFERADASMYASKTRLSRRNEG